MLRATHRRPRPENRRCRFGSWLAPTQHTQPPPRAARAFKGKKITSSPAFLSPSFTPYLEKNFGSDCSPTANTLAPTADTAAAAVRCNHLAAARCHHHLHERKNKLQPILHRKGRAPAAYALFNTLNLCVKWHHLKTLAPQAKPLTS